MSLAQTATTGDGAAIPLYANTAPGSESWSQVEQEAAFGDQRIVRNIVSPSLLTYLADADNNTGKAVIFAPGGGFKFLSIDQEGIFVAQRLNQCGINAFVLKYRTDETATSDFGFGFGFGWQMMRLFGGAYLRSLFSSQSSYPERPLSAVQELAIADALQAIRLVRERADEWQIRTDAIGVMAFRRVERWPTARPFAVKRKASLTSSPRFTVFQLAADDDLIVPVQWSQSLHERWKDAGFSSTVHRYGEGGHGFGMRRRGLPIDSWIDQFHTWLVDGSPGVDRRDEWRPRCASICCIGYNPVALSRSHGKYPGGWL